MNQPFHFEDLHVGDRWQSRARTITEADVVAFAGLTGDYDPLHVDHEFVKHTPFGKPIAHGLLGLSFLAGLGSHFPMVQTVAFVSVRNWEFLRPVFIGDTVHAVNEIAELKENGHRRGTVVWKRQLVNHRGEVLQQGTFETLVARKDSPKSVTAKAPAAAKVPATAKPPTTVRSPSAATRRKGTNPEAPKSKPRKTSGRSSLRDKVQQDKVEKEKRRKEKGST